ncbi:putative membrane protein [Desulfosporosinus acidiphilus SJ4]|uniref:Putative membrane protein n=1 Tax=Desulfosporosinus acidiphilus (strain DSM 22704 / JCM 16185 / SJ4) TaxID=646529 RepID=I4D345_DESAJ|nr:DUF2157 domain-containing protein [Desulfosporosinus acidiphilus]AFM40219.1 putative membrane protein [Desulfosporosinus acidiphilus SJ4]
MKRAINKSKFSFIGEELDYYRMNGLISDQQTKDILEIYEIKEGLNFIRTLVTMGAILVGLGILSFIASNWDGLNNMAKLSIIFIAFGGSNFAGYVLEDHYPKTGRSLIYLGTLVYGAGIFLIGQLYNFGGNFSTAFLLWALGVVPMALQLKDKYLMLFANVLFGIYLAGTVQQGFPYAAVIGLPVLYYAFKFLNRSKLLLFFANAVSLEFILVLLLRCETKGLYVALTFLLIGLLMYGTANRFKRGIVKIQGNIILGVSGVFLTFPGFWEVLVSLQSARIASIIFSLLFVGLLFALIRRGSVISLIFVCLTIFRYYIDTFAFLPKSLFFILGGLLLLGFGFYIERVRKQSKGGILP